MAAYLKDTRPLSDYVNAKDTYDHSRGGYTTTGNLTAQPGAKIRTMQRQLNRAGYTDKFGEPLKEDAAFWELELGAMANNAAVLSQNTGAMQPYKITVNFYTTR